MSKTLEPIMQELRDKPLTYIVQAVGILLFVGNLYMASLLFPILQDLDRITSRVSALEKQSDEGQKLVERFFVVEEQVREVNRKIDRIEDKLDTIGSLLTR